MQQQLVLTNVNSWKGNMGWQPDYIKVSHNDLNIVSISKLFRQTRNGSDVGIYSYYIVKNTSPYNQKWLYKHRFYCSVGYTEDGVK